MRTSVVLLVSALILGQGPIATADLSPSPAVSEGYERMIVDRKVLLVEIATQTVHDVLTDALLD